MLEEIQKERSLAELERRRQMYNDLIEAGYKCQDHNHREYFRTLCIDDVCDLEPLIEELNRGRLTEEPQIHFEQEEISTEL